MIAGFWHESFDALAPQHRVLDVASGNGALPRRLLGLDGGSDRGCNIDAIDLAALAPGWLGELDAGQRARLRLHSGVMAEQLPFADATFDLVVSQYGIEYADLARAVPEAARVLRPHGRLRLLMHHVDALPVRKGAVEARLVERLLEPSGLFACAGPMLPWLALAASADGRAQLHGNAKANGDRAAFNVCQQRIDSDLAGAGADADVLHEARDQVQQLFALAQSEGVEQAGNGLRALRQGYAEHLLRARELVAHALDSARMSDVMRQLDGLGFALVSAMPLSYQSHLMGWAVRADRG